MQRTLTTSTPTGACVTILAVAKVNRNEPCPCGSGRKAKRCCGIERGPSEESLARAFLAGASREAAGKLRPLANAELMDLFEGLWGLPARHLSLQVELPKLLSPVLNRLCEAVAEDDPDPELLDDAVVSVDIPIERARLGRAVIAQAHAQTIGQHLADAALIDLGSDSRQFLRAALLQAAAVRVGAERTPAGILLAA